MISEQAELSIGEMNTVALAEQFEDLIAWQKAREMNRAIYQTTATGTFSRDFALRDQIRRASISVMSNIAEGFDRRSRSEFRQFLGIAKGSFAEVRCQLYIAQDAGYLEVLEAERLRLLAAEVSRIIGGLQTSLST